MKKFVCFAGVALMIIALTSCSKKDTKPAEAATDVVVTESVIETNASDAFNIVASTSWTAAFADIAGANQVQVIAPANLRHPPEYEVTVSDIQKIMDSDFFIFAGFERMMKTLGDNVAENTEMVKVSCNNSIETVTAESKKIAALFGTEEVCTARLAEYVDVIQKAAADIKAKGLENTKVLCNSNQIYLAKDLGFDVAATFGPGPVSSDQIADAKTGGYTLIIDNIHNPVGEPLAEVAPDAKYIIWRNFPDQVEHNALKNVIESNIAALNF